VVSLDDRRGYGQSQPKAAGLPGPRLIGADEPFEQVRQQFPVDSRTVIGDGQFHVPRSVIGSARRDKVALDPRLRQHMRTALEEARSIASQSSPPPPIRNWKKCRDCSLEPICLPREVMQLQQQPGKKDLRDGDSVLD